MDQEENSLTGVDNTPDLAPHRLIDKCVNFSQSQWPCLVRISTTLRLIGLTQGCVGIVDAPRLRIFLPNRKRTQGLSENCTTLKIKTPQHCVEIAQLRGALELLML